MKILIVYFSLLFLPLMCKTASEDDSLNDVVASKTEDAAYIVEESVEATEDAESSNSSTSLEIPKELKIIKTGNIRYQVNDLNKEAQKIQELTKKHNGYIQEDNSSNSTYDLSKNLTIRLPHQKFDDFIDDLSKGVDYFEYKNIQAQDVTEEFIDVEARLKTQKELEKRYLALLNQAKTIKDILEIERELNNIRQDIESKEGRLKYLQNKVSWSTLDLNIYTPQAKSAHVSVSYFSKIWQAIKSGWNGLLSFFIGLLHIWPFIIISIILIIFVKRKFKKKQQDV